MMIMMMGTNVRKIVMPVMEIKIIDIIIKRQEYCQSLCLAPHVKTKVAHINL